MNNSTESEQTSTTTQSMTTPSEENNFKLRYAMIPQEYQHSSFENYVPANDSQERALADCRVYYCDDYGLYLCGPPGTGKTHMAIAILRFDCIEFESDGFFIRTTDLLNRLRPPEPDYVLKDAAETANLLVLDDLGVQKDSPWTYETLTGILDTRLINQRQTIITSNYPLEVMGNGGGIESQRIVSRIKQMCDVVLIKGNDYRDKQIRQRGRKSERHGKITGNKIENHNQ